MSTFGYSLVYKGGGKLIVLFPGLLFFFFLSKENSLKMEMQTDLNFTIRRTGWV